jgi:tRNA threonylcarbamoyl adenosine modification protein YeaZ
MPDSSKQAPRVLAIETATNVCGVALAEGGRLTGEAVVDGGLSHSSKLIEMVGRVLGDSSLELSQVDALAVSVGPGSFTGVRIGLGTALGLAAGTGLPIVPVPTLDALAWAQLPFSGIVCAFTDARRGEVYYSLYEADGSGIRRLTEYVVRASDAIWSALRNAISDRSGGTEVLLAGPRVLVEKASMESGAMRLREDPGDREGRGPVIVPDVAGRRVSPEGAGPGAAASGVLVASPERATPKPAAVATLGVELFRRGKARAVEEVKPIYVRRSDAELRRRKKTGAP